MAKLENIKYEKFCRAYAISLNQTEAAIEAGYSPASARNQGYRLMANANVKKRIDELLGDIQKKAEEKYDITIERVLQEYAKLAFYNPKDFYNADGSIKPIDELDDELAAVITGFDVNDIYEWDKDEKKRVKTGQCKKIKLTDKRGALDGLAKTLTMFNKDSAPKDNNVTAIEYVFGDDEQ